MFAATRVGSRASLVFQLLIIIGKRIKCRGRHEPHIHFPGCVPSDGGNLLNTNINYQLSLSIDISFNYTRDP